MKKPLCTAFLALLAMTTLGPRPAVSQTRLEAPSKAEHKNANRGKSDKWGIYSELTSLGNHLSCWICQQKSAGTALCPGYVLIPVGQWDKADQAVGSACALKSSGRCRVVGNQRCPDQ